MNSDNLTDATTMNSDNIDTRAIIDTLNASTYLMINSCCKFLLLIDFDFKTVYNT